MGPWSLTEGTFPVTRRVKVSSHQLHVPQALFSHPFATSRAVEAWATQNGQSQAAGMSDAAA